MNTPQNVIKKNGMLRTKAAMVLFNASQAYRDSLWDAVKCKDDVNAAELADKVALDLVRQAFYQNTKEYNTEVDCMRLRINDFTIYNQIRLDLP